MTKMTSKLYAKGGGESCSIHGCSNNRRKLYIWKQSHCETHGTCHKDCPCLQPFVLHRMPKNPEKQKIWIKAINRKNPPKNIYACSRHFVDGHPTELNPYPTLNLGYSHSNVSSCRKLPKRRLLTSVEGEKSKKSKPISSVVGCSEMMSCNQAENPALTDHAESMDVSNKCTSINEQPGCLSKSDVGTQWEDHSLTDHTYNLMVEKPKLVDVNIQTTAPRMLNIGCMCQLTGGAMTVTEINTDADALHYVGIHKDCFITLISVMESQPGVPSNFGIPIGDQILLCLMRIKHNYVLEDLSRRFKISVSLVSNVFNTWVPLLACTLRKLIVWLPRETIRSCLPATFEKYPKTTCIIDCSETFIQRPQNLRIRAQTYSNYKGHNTVKYLVGMAPHGHVMFISRAYGGRASDVFITEDSKFLDYLRPGDEIMADRGFTIDELLFPRRVKLNIPSFLKGRKQLSAENVTETRRIAHVRIHIERLIRRLKVYKFLSDTVTVSSRSQFDNILEICGGLVNLCPDLIRDKVQENLNDG